MASSSCQAMLVVSTQEHWSHFLSVLRPLTSDLPGSKRACRVTAGGRSVSFYHAMLGEAREEEERSVEEEQEPKKENVGDLNASQHFLLLIRGGRYSSKERSLMEALVSSFGAKAVGRLAVVSLDDKETDGTQDHNLLELMDACQGRYCRMTPSTALDGLDVLLHLLHFMPLEQHHLTEARRSRKSSRSGGGQEAKALCHQELQAKEEEEERTFLLRAEQQEWRRAAELQQLMAKHAEERQQEEKERRHFWMKREGLEEEVVRRSHRARLQQQISVTSDEMKTSVVLLGVSGSGKTSALALIAQRAANQLGPGAPHWTRPRPQPTRCCQRTKVMLRVEGQGEGRGVRQLVLVDTPELWDEDGREEAELVRDCLALALPGPHVFLLVLQLGRFTQAENHMLGHFQRIFGQDFAERALVLFVQQQQQESHLHLESHLLQRSHLHQVPKQGVCEYVCGAHPSLQALVRRCGARFHQLTIDHGGAGENGDWSSLQVRELLAAVDKLAAAHGGRPYQGRRFSVVELQERRRAMKEGGAGVLEGNCLLTDS